MIVVYFKEPRPSGFVNAYLICNSIFIECLCQINIFIKLLTNYGNLNVSI